MKDFHIDTKTLGAWVGRQDDLQLAIEALETSKSLDLIYSEVSSMSEAAASRSFSTVAKSSP